MAERDTAGVIMPPPIAWLLAVVAGVELDRFFAQGLHGLSPLPRFAVGGLLLALAVALAGWSVRTMRQRGTRFETSQPSTAIVSDGPYRFSRNPIYTGMVVALVGLAIALDNAWLLVVLVPFYLVIRYGVIAREEAYLERKFGAPYLAYKSAVRRWL